MPTDDWRVPRPVRRVEADPAADAAAQVGWPFTLPAVRQLLAEGLDLGSATILVGENGSGKSTVLEALALAYGLNAEGGSTGAMHRTRATESPLSDHLRLVRGAGASRSGFFLRAETMHGFYSYLESVGMASFHERSHGESFLDVIDARCFTRAGAPSPGLFLFDEVESALSFTSSLRVLATLRELAAAPGTQVVLATHSPVLAALPGARLVELGADGFRDVEWADLEVVVSERAFLADPGRFLRHL